MATTIVTKYGGDAPAASDIVRGELAVDTENGRLYTENAAGAVVEIGLNPEGNVDVTGTVTADGLTVGNGTQQSRFYIDADEVSQLIDGSVRYDIWTGGNKTMRLDANGDISFYEDTGTTAKLFWDASAESLGIGTSSLTSNASLSIAQGGVHVDGGASGGASQVILSTGASSGANFGQISNTGTRWSLGYGGTQQTVGTEVLTWNSSGNVGIGTSSMGFNGQGLPLVVGSGTGNTGMTIFSGADSYGTLQFADAVTTGAASYAGVVSYNHTNNFMYFSTASTERLRIDSSGNVDIKTVGSAASPSLHFGGDSDTGLFKPISNTLAFSTFGTERLRIDASGNVGIGVTSPNATIEANITTSGSGANNNTAGSSIGVGTSSTTQPIVGMRWTGASHVGISGFAFSTQIVNDTVTSNAFEMYTTGATPVVFGTASVERMRLDTSGNLLVGTTTAANQGVTIYGGGANGIYSKTTSTSAYWITNDGITSATGTLFTFYNNATYCGGVTITSTNVTNYNSASDQRLKENIADADDSGSKIDAIQVRKFDWKADGSHQDYGMVAQELLKVAPEAVHQPQDPEEMMGVDYSKLVPMMLKEIQSLRARVAALES